MATKYHVAGLLSVVLGAGLALVAGPAAHAACDGTAPPVVVDGVAAVPDASGYTLVISSITMDACYDRASVTIGESTSASGGFPTVDSVEVTDTTPAAYSHHFDRGPGAYSVTLGATGFVGEDYTDLFTLGAAHAVTVLPPCLEPLELTGVSATGGVGTASLVIENVDLPCSSTATLTIELREGDGPARTVDTLDVAVRDFEISYSKTFPAAAGNVTFILTPRAGETTGTPVSAPTVVLPVATATPTPTVTPTPTRTSSATPTPLDASSTSASGPPTALIVTLLALLVAVGVAVAVAITRFRASRTATGSPAPEASSTE